MLQAMNTGHDGSITTVHSNSPRDTLSRIETMTLMAGMDLPVRVIREQMASALDLIVHLQRLRDGTRRVTHVSEVMGMEGDVIVLQDIYSFDFGAGHRRRGQVPRRAQVNRHPPVVLRAARRLRHRARAVAVREQRRRCGSLARDERRVPDARDRHIGRRVLGGVRRRSAGLLVGDDLHVGRPARQDRAPPRRPDGTGPGRRGRRPTVPEPARPGHGRDEDDAACRRPHRPPRRPCRAADPDRGRAGAGRPAVAPARSIVLLLRRRVRGGRARVC